MSWNYTFCFLQIEFGNISINLTPYIIIWYIYFNHETSDQSICWFGESVEAFKDKLTYQKVAKQEYYQTTHHMQIFRFNFVKPEYLITPQKESIRDFIW